MKHQIIVSAIISAVLALFNVLVVSAHGDEPRLEISADRLNPGSVVEVRGVDFEPEEAVALALVGDGIEIALSEITADYDGVFLQIITLPNDVSEGVCTFRALTDDHEVHSAAITVWGTGAVEGEDSGGPIDEDDTLLAPMPTYLAPYPTSVPQAEKQAQPTLDLGMPMLIAGVLAAIVFFVVLGLKLRKQ